jgi:hypothetical protein
MSTSERPVEPELTDHSLVEGNSEFLSGFKTFDAFSQTLFETLIKATKIANELPDFDEHAYYASTFRPFKLKMDQVLNGPFLSVCVCKLAKRGS